MPDRRYNGNRMVLFYRWEKMAAFSTEEFFLFSMFIFLSILRFSHCFYRWSHSFILSWLRMRLFFSSSSANVKTKSNRKTMERQILHDNIMRCGDTNPNCYDIIVYDGIKSDANRALFSSAHCVRCLNN